MVRRNRDQICLDIIRECPSTISRISRGANVSYVRCLVFIGKMIADGLIMVKEECPRLYGVNRKTPANIYHATPEGLELLESKH